MSKISLVDLAGSERAVATGAQGDRLKEGSNINKSLTTLRNVISGLAKGKDFIPYRDSHLTWLLKENLGGNSKTAMIANLSPACVNYDETLSTLKYANSAKEIVCKAKVNEDANVKLIRELKEEIQMLRNLLEKEGLNLENQDGQRPMTSHANRPQLNSMGSKEESKTQMLADKIEQTEKLINELNETWEEKKEKSKQLKQDREDILREIGVITHEIGVFSPKDTPSLVNLNEDPMMNECLIYYLKIGFTRIGRAEADILQDIQLSGSNILKEHCIFENRENAVTLIPCKNAQCYVNGILITEPFLLQTGCRVILGKHHVFRFQNPLEVRSIQSSAKKEGKEEPTVVDWNFAQLELQEKQGIDLKQEMESKFIELAEKCRKEKEEAQQYFDEQEKMYKETIKNLYEQLQQSISMQASRDTLESSIKQPLANHIEMLNKNKFPAYIFEDLKNDREIQLCKKVLAKWKSHQFTSLRDDLWGKL